MNFKLTPAKLVQFVQSPLSKRKLKIRRRPEPCPLAEVHGKGERPSFALERWPRRGRAARPSSRDWPPRRSATSPTRSEGRPLAQPRSPTLPQGGGGPAQVQGARPRGAQALSPRGRRRRFGSGVVTARDPAAFLHHGARRRALWSPRVVKLLYCNDLYLCHVTQRSSATPCRAPGQPPCR